MKKSELKKLIKETINEESFAKGGWNELMNLKETLGADKLIDEIGNYLDSAELKEMVEFIGDNWGV